MDLDLKGGSLVPVFVGEHPPAVHFLLVDSTLVMDRAVDQRRVHEGDGGERHQLQSPVGTSRRGGLDRLHDVRAAVTSHPDAATLHGAI